MPWADSSFQVHAQVVKLMAEILVTSSVQQICSGVLMGIEANAWLVLVQAGGRVDA